jgi:hypothetical protein
MSLQPPATRTFFDRLIFDTEGGVIRSSETSVQIRSDRRHIPDDSKHSELSLLETQILHSFVLSQIFHSFDNQNHEK